MKKLKLWVLVLQVCMCIEKKSEPTYDIFSMETLNILTIVWYPKSIEFGLSLSSVGGGTTGALLLPAALLVLQPLGEVIT